MVKDVGLEEVLKTEVNKPKATKFKATKAKDLNLLTKHNNKMMQKIIKHITSPMKMLIMAFFY